MTLPGATRIQVDSPLGRWTQHEWRPAHLAGVVDYLWLFEGRLTHLRERTFPTGKLELTRTRLATAFREQIGATPKLYARILRFRRVLELLHQGAGSLADLAVAAGYYDQPHMNAEFRELGGLTPRELLAAHRYPNSVSIAETA